MQVDDPLLSVCRYVERNALRAGLVGREEDWPHGSLALRCMREGMPEAEPDADEAAGPAVAAIRLGPWPVARPTDWIERVNAPRPDEEEASLRRCLLRGSPFGTEAWAQRASGELGLQSTIRTPGRPRNTRANP